MINQKEICLGIDLGYRNIKFVELYKEGDDVFLKDFVVAPSAFSDEESEEERINSIRHIIDTAIRDRKFNTTNVYLTFSDPLIFTRFVKVPITDNKKTAQMISFEAMQQIPFPLEEVVWDYQIMKANIGEAEAVLCAVKKDIVNRLLTEIGTTLPNADVLDIGPLSMANMLYQNDDISTHEDCHAILNLGAKSSYVIVMNRDIFWLRILPVGGDSVTQAIQKSFDIDFETAEEYKLKGMISSEKKAGTESEFNKRLNDQITSIYTKIVFEFKRSLNFFRTQYPGEKISQLYLTGGGSLVSGMKDFSAKNFPGMTLKEFQPFNRIIISDLVDKESLAENTSFIGEAVGLALRGLGQSRLNIDLMPAEVVAGKMRKKNFKFYAASLAFFAMIFLSKSTYDSRIANTYEQRIQTYNSRLEELKILGREYEKEKKKTQVMTRNLGVIHNFYTRKTFWLHFVSHLEQLKTEQIWITAFRNVDFLEEYRRMKNQENKAMATYSRRKEKKDLLLPEMLKPHFLIIEGETSTEYEAISQFESGLKKIPSVITDVPFACVISAMNCACMSVGKPG